LKDSVIDDLQSFYGRIAAGILMVVLAFWSSAQFLTTKAYTLLLFSGIWALLHGVTDIIKSFEIRKIKKMVV